MIVILSTSISVDFTIFFYQKILRYFTWKRYSYTNQNHPKRALQILIIIPKRFIKKKRISWHHLHYQFVAETSIKDLVLLSPTSRHIPATTPIKRPSSVATLPSSSLHGKKIHKNPIHARASARQPSLSGGNKKRPSLVSALPREFKIEFE